jgi:phage terminase small subunit
LLIYISNRANATQNYIDAGYKATKRAVAEANVRKLLGNYSVKNYIDERVKPNEEKRIMDADEARELLTSIARGEVTETVVTATGKKEIKKADINQRIKAVDSVMKRFNVVASLDKTKAESEDIKEKTKILKGAAKDTSLLDALINAVKSDD